MCRIKTSRLTVPFSSSSIPNYFLVSPNNGTLVGSPTQQISKCYEYFRILSFSYEWIPSVGMTTGGTVISGIIEDSQAMYDLIPNADARYDQLILTQGTRSYPANVGHSRAFNMGKVLARKWFRVDNDGSDDRPQLENSVPFGLLLNVASSSSGTIGFLQLHMHVEFKNLRSSKTTELGGGKRGLPCIYNPGIGEYCGKPPPTGEPSNPSPEPEPKPPTEPEPPSDPKPEPKPPTEPIPEFEIENKV